MASSSENPIIGDNDLQKLLTKVNTLQTEKEFIKWRKSFLKVYASYLDPDGVLNAKDANDRLLKKLAALSNRCARVKDMIRTYNIHPEQATAEGRRALSNLADELGNAERAINDFMPKTTTDEDRIGYDKFELSAILIQDGFHGYDLMDKTRDFLKQTFTGNLKHTVDENFMKIIKYYSNSLDIFVQVMEDLGLYKIMKQCTDVVYKGKQRPDPKPASTHETQKVTEETTKRKASYQNGTDQSFVQTPPKEADKAVILPLHVATWSNKTVFGNAQSPLNEADQQEKQYSEDEVEIEEMDRKKKDDEEEKNEEDGEGGEFLFYFDPKTNAIGTIGRSECGAKSKLLVNLSKEGKDAYQGIIEEEDERQQIIWLLKKLEKTKPVEKSWLEEIKKEKAEKQQGMQKKSGRKMPSGKTGSTEALKSSSNTSRSTTNRESGKLRVRGEMSGSSHHSGDSTGADQQRFRNPFEIGSSTEKTKKSTVEDYQGKYKKVAAKPDSSGWKKIS